MLGHDPEALATEPVTTGTRRGDPVTATGGLEQGLRAPPQASLQQPPNDRVHW